MEEEIIEEIIEETGALYEEYHQLPPAPTFGELLWMILEVGVTECLAYLISILATLNAALTELAELNTELDMFEGGLSPEDLENYGGMISGARGDLGTLIYDIGVYKATLELWIDYLETYY